MKELSKLFLWSFIIGFILGVSFLAGRHYGYNECQNKFLKDYEYQGKQIDTLQNRTHKLKQTYDSIKASPCYKQ